MNVRTLPFIVTFLLMAPACGSGPEAGEPEPGAAAFSAAPAGREAPRVVAYRCDGDLEIVVEFEAGGRSAWLFLPGDSLELSRDADSAPWVGGGVTFRPGGGGAVLVREGEELECREDPRRSVIEGAKLRGADFWATGNEPGWVLELHPDRAVLVTDSGGHRSEIPVGPPDEDRENRTTTWRGSAGGHELVVVLSPGPCRDTMADETLETRVTVVIDGRTLSGCGMALH